MNDNLFIYEFPHNSNKNIYINKQLVADDNFKFFSELYNKIIYLKNILPNNTFMRDLAGNCTTQDIENTWVFDSTNDYNYRACDPLQFEYDIYNSKFSGTHKLGYKIDHINSYEHDPNRVEIVKGIFLNLGMKSCAITNIIQNIFLLPEMNTISVFDSVYDNYSIVTKNYLLKDYELTKETFLKTLSKFKKLYSQTINSNEILKKHIMDGENGESKWNPNYYTTEEAYRKNYAEKLYLDENSKVCFFGDIHGAVHTLARSILRLVFLGYMNKSYKCASNFYIIFLGDLVDRSIYGIETIVLIMELKLKNPNNVFIIKGNHENCCTNKDYRFDKEFKKLDIKKNYSLYNQYCNVWQYLPVAIFLKIGEKPYIQLCHGGLYRDPYIIKQFLESDNKIQVFTKYTNDFQWSTFSGDFTIDLNSKGIFGDGSEKRRTYYLKETVAYLNITNIRFVIRGHDDLCHNTKMVVKDELDFVKIENVVTRDLIKSDDGVSYFKIPIVEQVADINSYIDKYTFAPIITLTTGIPSRFVEADGFAILNNSTNDLQPVLDNSSESEDDDDDITLVDSDNSNSEYSDDSDDDWDSQSGGNKYKYYKNKYLEKKHLFYNVLTN